MTTLKYKLLHNEGYLGTNGSTTLQENQAVSFSSLDDAQTFVEASGSIGEYRVRMVVEKSE